jgi:integrase
MRFGKLLGIRETDVDLEHGKLTVDQTLKRSGPQVAFGKPKTPQSRRTITLPAEVVDGLRQIRRWRIEQKLRLGPKFQDYGLVFCLPNVEAPPSEQQPPKRLLPKAPATGTTENTTSRPSGV